MAQQLGEIGSEDELTRALYSVDEKIIRGTLTIKVLTMLYSRLLFNRVLPAWATVVV